MKAAHHGSTVRRHPRRKKNAVLTDRTPPPVTVRRKELVTRLQAGQCELRKQTGMVVYATMSASSPTWNDRATPAVWDQLMARRRRKTLVVCASCHKAIHNGQPTAAPTQ